MSDSVVEEILKVLTTVGEDNHDLFAAYSCGGVYTYELNPRKEFTLEHGYPPTGRFVGSVEVVDRLDNDLLFYRNSPYRNWLQVKPTLEILPAGGSHATVSPDGSIYVDGDGDVYMWTYPSADGKSTRYYKINDMWVYQDPVEVVIDSADEDIDPVEEVIDSTAKELSLPTPEYTGGSSSYYSVHITNPTTEGRPTYTAECNDIIEALGMNYAEGNAFKALWRRAAARTLGLTKKGYDDGLYDAEKVEFFGKRLVVQSKNAN